MLRAVDILAMQDRAFLGVVIEDPNSPHPRNDLADVRDVCELERRDWVRDHAATHQLEAVRVAAERDGFPDLAAACAAAQNALVRAVEARACLIDGTIESLRQAEQNMLRRSDGVAAVARKRIAALLLEYAVHRTRPPRRRPMQYVALRNPDGSLGGLIPQPATAEPFNTNG